MKNASDLQSDLARLQQLNQLLQCQLDDKNNIILDCQNALSNNAIILSKKDTIIADQEKILAEKYSVIADNEKTITALQSKLEALQEQLAILLSKRYKAQSEQLKHLQGQLFDEAELETDIQATIDAIEAAEQAKAGTDKPASSTPASTPKIPEKPKRKPLPDSLPRVDIHIDVSAEDKQMMGDDWVLIGYETSEQLAVNQRQYFVKRIGRAKYVRKSPAEGAQADAARSSGIKVAPPAPVILPKAIADASLLADVLCSKFIDAMSFYRTHARLERDGIDIGYSTLCDWPIQLHQRLNRLEALFYEAIGQQSLWHLDETTLQVLDEVGRANQLTSYLWSIRAGPPDRPMVLFHYHERRNYAALEEWLRPCLVTFNGVIVTDEHAPYNTLVKNHPNIVAHGGCLAHCRRKFVEAAKGRRDNGDTQTVIRLIASVYNQENKLGHLSGQARVDVRQSTVKPLMDKLKSLLDQLAPKYTNKNAMGTAIGYALNNWRKFTAFLDHGELPIDNNAMERAIRPFTLGRNYVDINIMSTFAASSPAAIPRHALLGNNAVTHYFT